jgi:hypothetical protein
MATTNAPPRPFVESTANKPGPGRLVPIARLFLLAPTPAPKVRLAGRLLAVDATSGWLLLAGGGIVTDVSSAAIWVDIGVCQAGDGDGLAGVLAREGKGSCWMALGELDEVAVRPPPYRLPKTVADPPPLSLALESTRHSPRYRPTFRSAYPTHSVRRQTASCEPSSFGRSTTDRPAQEPLTSAPGKRLLRVALLAISIAKELA